MKKEDILEKPACIPGGFGRVFCVSSSDGTLISYGDACKIDAKDEGANVLDTYLVGAAHLFGGEILAVYRKPESEEIMVREFSGKAIFSEIN